MCNNPVLEFFMISFQVQTSFKAVVFGWEYSSDDKRQDQKWLSSCKLMADKVPYVTVYPFGGTFSVKGN